MSLETEITSNLHFDQDGLFYFGDQLGQVTVYDQTLNPKRGSKSLVIQGVEFGAVAGIFTQKDSLLVIAKDPRDEIVLFKKERGTFEFSCKYKLDLGTIGFEVCTLPDGSDYQVI